MTAKTYIIGRAGDITLYDDTVSRRHACLEIDGAAMVLTDLDSRNGTFEIRDNKLIPFSGGAVTLDQVFAFGECVRSVTQLLSELGLGIEGQTDTVGEPRQAGANPAVAAMATPFGVVPRRRLSPADIINILDEVEDGCASGQHLAALCAARGITEQRYHRWCREFGTTRADREQLVLELRRENERLRKLLADMSLERDVLKEVLKQNSGENVRPLAQSSPNLSIVSDGKSG